MKPAIGDGACVHPARKDRADGAPELLARILREGLTQFVGDRLLVAGDHLLPFGCGQIGVEFVAEAGLLVFQDFLEHLVVEPHDDVGIHLDEAAVGIPGEALVAALTGHGEHAVIVEAEIEDRVHHAGHRGARTGAHGEQQRTIGITESAAGHGADLFERRHDIRLETVGEGFAALVIGVAGFCCDRQPGRHGKTERTHLGEIGTLAAEKMVVLGRALRLAVTEDVNPLGHSHIPLKVPRTLAVLAPHTNPSNGLGARKGQRQGARAPHRPFISIERKKDGKSSPTGNSSRFIGCLFGYRLSDGVKPSGGKAWRGTWCQRHCAGEAR